MVLRLFGGLLRRAAQPPAPASATPEVGARVPAEADAHGVLRAWLAADSYPPYTLDELSADPLRQRVAELVAGRGDVDELQRLLGELLGRPSPAAVDRMLLADALLSRGSFEQAHSALLDVAGEPGRIGARACAKLVSVIYYQGEFERAGALIKQAMQGAPDAMYCRIFMGTLTDYEGDAAAALEHYRRAVALRPASVDARVALAMGLLRCDDLQEGFSEWVHAECLVGEYRRASAAPAWDGRPLHGERILLLTSNFFGDVMQMLRFARHLREREPQARMSIQIQEPLARLATDSGLFERVYVGPVTHDDFDWQATLTHIPLHLETGIADLRRFEPYLRVPPERSLEAATWLPPRRPGRLRIGLRWYGRAQYHNAKRSVPFELIRPLFAVPGIDWVALTEDAATLVQLGEHPLIDASQHLTDFSATGALMGHLDLTISVDTSIAHLAGALNLPFWLLAQPDPEWRWGRDETSSHWYGSARCFRHSHGFDWAALVREVVAALTERVAQSRVAGDAVTTSLPATALPSPAAVRQAHGQEATIQGLRRAVRARPLLPAAHLALAAGLLREGDAQAGLHAWVLAEQLAGESARACASPVWDGRALGRDRLLINALACGSGAAHILNFAQLLRAREPQSRLSLLLPAEAPAGFAASGLFERIYAGGLAQDAFDWQVTAAHLALLLELQAADLHGFAPDLQLPPFASGAG
jgi:hypothetical protein